MIEVPPFDRDKHIYNTASFEELIKDTIRFFNGTPVTHLPPPQFNGTGVYAIYYIGKFDLYQPLYDLNRYEFKQPIYVGKAVPFGWRTSRNREGSSAHGLCFRLKEHAKSIRQSENLNLEDFFCRFVILEHEATDLISTLEASLIRYYKPLWNCCLDGFGAHNPGSGRYKGAKSYWDLIHPGRYWAQRCQGETKATKEEIVEKIKNYFISPAI